MGTLKGCVQKLSSKRLKKKVLDPKIQLENKNKQLQKKFILTYRSDIEQKTNNLKIDHDIPIPNAEPIPIGSLTPATAEVKPVEPKSKTTTTKKPTQEIAEERELTNPGRVALIESLQRAKRDRDIDPNSKLKGKSDQELETIYKEGIDKINDLLKLVDGTNIPLDQIERKIISIRINNLVLSYSIGGANTAIQVAKLDKVRASKEITSKKPVDTQTSEELKSERAKLVKKSNKSAQDKARITAITNQLSKTDKQPESTKSSSSSSQSNTRLNNLERLVANKEKLKKSASDLVNKLKNKVSKIITKFEFTRDELFELNNPEHGFKYQDQIDQLISDPKFAAEQLKKKKAALNPVEALDVFTFLNPEDTSSAEYKKLEEAVDRLREENPEFGINEDGEPDGGSSVKIVFALERLQAFNKLKDKVSKFELTRDELSELENPTDSTSFNESGVPLNRFTQASINDPRTRFTLKQIRELIDNPAFLAKQINFINKLNAADSPITKLAEYEKTHPEEVEAANPDNGFGFVAPGLLKARQEADLFKEKFPNFTPKVVTILRRLEAFNKSSNKDASANRDTPELTRALNSERTAEEELSAAKKALEEEQNKTSEEPVDSTSVESTESTDPSRDDVFASESSGVKRIFQNYNIEGLEEQQKRLEKALASPEEIKGNSKQSSAERVTAARLNLEAVKIQIEFLKILAREDTNINSPEQTRHLVTLIAKLEKQLSLVDPGNSTHDRITKELKDAKEALARVTAENKEALDFTESKETEIKDNKTNLNFKDAIGASIRKLSVNTLESLGKVITVDGVESFRQKFTDKNTTAAQLIKFTSDKGLHTIPESAFTDEKEFVTELDKLGITEASAKVLFKEFTAYDKAYEEVKPRKIPRVSPAFKNPLSSLYDADGDLPVQLRFAMMVGTLEFLRAKPSSDIHVSDFAQKTLLYGGQMNGEITTIEAREASQIGHSHQFTTNMIGPSIARMLNMAPVDTEVSIFYEKLLPAIGTLALDIGQKVEFEGKGRFEIRTHTWNFNADPNINPKQIAEVNVDESTDADSAIQKDVERFFKDEFFESRIFAHGQDFKHLIMHENLADLFRGEKHKKQLPIGVAIDEASKNLNGENLADSQKPLNSPAKPIGKDIRNSLGGTTKEARSTIDKMQNVVWGLAQSFGMVPDIATLDRDALETLFGVKKINEGAAEKDYKDSVDSANRAKTATIDFILDQAEQGNLDDHYYAYRFLIQQRILQEGLSSPQSDKISRVVLKPQSSNTVYSRENIHLFIVSTMFNLGFSVEREHPTNIVDEFENAMKNKTLLAAIKARRRVVNSKNKQTIADSNKKIIELLPKLQQDYPKAGPNLLDALEGLSRYLPYHETRGLNHTVNGARNTKKVRSFESDIGYEVDGMTNGFAMSYFQFPLFDDSILEKRGNQLGIYEGTNKKHFIDGTYKRKANESDAEFTKRRLDAYYDFGDEVDKASSSIKNAHGFTESESVAWKFWNKRNFDNPDYKFPNSTYTAFDIALRKIYEPLSSGDTRKFVKTPFISAGYTAGSKSISRNVAKDILKDVRRQISELRAEYQSLGTIKSQIESINKQIAIKKTEKRSGAAVKRLEAEIVTLRNSFSIPVPEGTTVTKLQKEFKNTIVAPFAENLRMLGVPSTNLTTLIDQIARSPLGQKSLPDIKINEAAFINNISWTLQPRFDAAMKEMFGDTEDAKAAVIQSAEIMYALFIPELETARAARKKLLNRGVTKKAGTGRDLSNSEELELIRTKLIEFLPQYRGPLMDFDASVFIDLSKSRPSTNNTLNQSNTIETNYFDRDHVDPKTGKPAPNRSRSSAAKVREYIPPRSSALVNLILNTDATIFQQAMDSTPDILPLHDAGYGAARKLLQFSDVYNPKFYELSKKHSVLASIAQQMQDMIDKASPETITAAETWIKQEGFVNKHKEEEKKKSLEDLLSGIKEQVVIVNDARSILFNKLDKGHTIVQMYSADVASTNPKAGKDYSDEKAEAHKNNTEHRKNVFFKEVGKVSDSLITAYKKLFSLQGPTEAFKMLEEYTPENTFQYVILAREDSKQPNPVKSALNVINGFRTKGDIIAETILTDFIQNNGKNDSLVQQYVAKLEEGVDTEGNKIDPEVRRQQLIDQLKTYAKTPDFTREDTFLEEEIDSVKEQILSLDNLARTNPEPVESTDITGNNIKKLFNKFKKISRGYYQSDADMESHSSVLENIINIMSTSIDDVRRIELEVEKIDGISQGRYNTERRKARVSLSKQPPASANGQPSQEVYTHELVHAMTIHALKDSALVRQRLQRFFDQTKANVDSQGKYEVFLAGIDNPTDRDIAMAKEQYRYAFNNPDNETNKLAEFLAYATTNKALVKHLQNTKFEKEKIGNSPMELITKIVNLVVDTFTKFMQKAARRDSPTSHEEMIAIVEQLVQIQSKNEHRATRAFSSIIRKTDEYDKKINEIVAAEVRKIRRSRPAGGLKRVVRRVVGGTDILLSSNAEVAKFRREAIFKHEDTLRQIALELGDGVFDSEELVERLLKNKNQVSAARQKTEVDMIDWTNNIWKSVDYKDPRQVPIETKEALTDVILKADLSSLLDVAIDPELIADMMDKPDVIREYKEILRGRMKLRHSDSALIYANELGEKIATGNPTVRQSFQNVNGIVAKHISPKQKQRSPDIEQFMDAYVSLVALEKLDPRRRKTVSDFLKKEFDADKQENGFIDILLYHREFKEASKEQLFDGNPAQMWKGWVVERVDNLTSMKTGLASQEKEMRAESYRESFSLGEIPGVKVPHDTIYISRDMPETEYVTGLTSQTNQRSIGTTLTDILKRDEANTTANGGIDYVKIKQKIDAVHKHESNIAKNPKKEKGLKLQPIRDDKHNISDYRVIMNHHAKETLLKPDREFQNVFAHMHSSLLDKKATIEADKATIDILVNEWVERMPEGKDTFINILDPESPFHDRFRRLPKAVQIHFEQYIVDGQFMVRKDVVNKVFGFTAWDASNLKLLQGENKAQARWLARLAQYITTQTVSYGMDRIVIGTQEVVTGNLQSNFFQLLMRKISPAFIINKTWEGYQEFRVYQADASKIRRLNREIAAKKLGENSPEQLEVNAATVRLESNKLHAMTEAGVNSMIVEDLNEASKVGYISRMQQILKTEKWTNRLDNIPAPVRKTVGFLATTAFMTRSSYPYRFLKHIVQVSDFLGRYVLIEHLTKVKGIPFKQALHESINAFVLFDENLTPALHAINSVAGTLFISYWMRNQRSARAILRGSPTAVLSALGLQEFTDIEATANLGSSFIGLDLLPNVLQQDEVLSKVTEATLLEQLI